MPALTFLTTSMLFWTTLFNTCDTIMAAMSPTFPAILIFGDSTVDTGNNNYIKTLAKANFPPYGQDFPGHVPTGRFSNGKLVPDFIASLLGIKDLVPPFLDPTLSPDELVSGACFASAGSGYDDLTTVLTNVVPVSEQLGLFRDYITRLQKSVGEKDAKKIVRNALVIISAGTNDWALNFYDIPTRRLGFSVDGYQDFLISKIQNFVQGLYDLGCRTMVVSGLPPIGCLPIQMTTKLEIKNRKCLENQNSDAQSYNAKLRKMLHVSQEMLQGSKIIYVDVYGPLYDMMTNPLNYGFTETKRGCCGTGLIEGSFLCNSKLLLCDNSSEFLFWDSIHPTQATYLHLTKYLIDKIRPKLL